jgi:AraC-like DNA-binding protein
MVRGLGARNCKQQAQTRCQQCRRYDAAHPANARRRPHECVTTRRVERAKQFLQGRGDLSLAEVAAQAGFSGPEPVSRHFKRLVIVTPRQFRMSARIA